MKAKSRCQFTSSFKVKVVLEVLRQEKTLSQIASENELHPQLLQTWKQTFLAAAAQVFEQQKEVEKPVSDETLDTCQTIDRTVSNRDTIRPQPVVLPPVRCALQHSLKQALDRCLKTYRLISSLAAILPTRSHISGGPPALVDSTASL